MKNKLTKLTLIFLAMSLFSCSANDPKIYSKNLPKFDVRDYFNGKLEAYGILKDRSGKVTKTFTVKMTGSWNGNEGKLEEDFVFSDGKVDRRVWEISVIDDNNFTAKAHDVVGIAKGQQYGNAMKMEYVLTVPVDNKKYDIKISDWLYLVDKNSLVNVSDMKKFGFKVGSLAIGFKKLD
jgi:hypothetical protein